MRVIPLLTLIVIIGFIYIYNTNRFQSLFLDDFYDDIAYIKFDVIRKNETISIPINHKYKTCYDLGITVPGKKFSAYPNEGPGQLRYKFISNGNLLIEGVTKRFSRHSIGGNDKHTILKLIVFDLPLRKQVDDLTIKLTVVEPFSFLEEYKGHTSIVINPNYSAKFGKCYNEKLRIEQP